MYELFLSATTAAIAAIVDNMQAAVQISVTYSVKSFQGCLHIFFQGDFNVWRAFQLVLLK